VQNNFNEEYNPIHPRGFDKTRESLCSKARHYIECFDPEAPKISRGRRSTKRGPGDPVTNAGIKIVFEINRMVKGRIV